MTFLGALALLPLLFGFTTSGAVQVRSLVVENEVILRIPVRPPPRAIEWKERKGPKCIDTDEIKGAFLAGDDHVDFVLTKRRMFRARLDENCPALDFYGGFYLTSEDHKVCARRDAIRSRMGARCRIEKFRKLVPAD